MPLNLSFTHLMVVGFVALVVLGPERLPGVARTAGNLYREWKRISGGFQAEMRDVLHEFTEPFAEPINEILHGPTATAADAGGAPVPGTAPLDVLPPLGGGSGPPSSGGVPGNGQPAVTPLAPAIPALGESSGLFVPGPVRSVSFPSLGPAPHPETFVPFVPGPPPGRDG